MNYIITAVVTAGIVPYVSPVANGYSAIYVVRTTYMSVYLLTLGDVYVSKTLKIIFISLKFCMQRQ